MSTAKTTASPMLPANPLELVTTKDEPRIDSAALAMSLGNQHRPTMALIEKYQESLQTFGKVLFKKTPSPNGQTVKLAMLNEDQALFMLSLSRNTERVVGLKAKLIQAFGVARREAAQRKTEYLPEYHQLHNKVAALAGDSENARWAHINLNRLVNRAVGIDAGQRGKAPISTLATAQAVAALALHGAENHRDGYQRAKTALQAFEALLRPPVGGLIHE